MIRCLPTRLAGAHELAAGCALLAVAFAAFDAHAQSDQADVQAAARAFAEAQRAQLRGDPAQAARMYELADSIAAAPEALRSAIRSHREAGQPARAATLARAAERRYPDDPETSELATEVLAEFGPALTELSLHCDEPCAVVCDDQAVATTSARHLEFFVAPGEHAIRARFDADRELRRRITAQPGQRLELAFMAPPALPAPVVDRPTLLPDSALLPALAQPERTARTRDSDGLPKWLFWTAASVTAAASGAALISGLDMLDKRERYRAAPTRDGYEQGKNSEVRTNVLLVSAGALSMLTAGLVFFTDWDGDERFSPSVAASPDGAVLLLRRRLQ